MRTKSCYVAAAIIAVAAVLAGSAVAQQQEAPRQEIKVVNAEVEPLAPGVLEVEPATDSVLLGPRSNGHRTLGFLKNPIELVSEVYISGNVPKKDTDPLIHTLGYHARESMWRKETAERWKIGARIGAEFGKF